MQRNNDTARKLAHHLGNSLSPSTNSALHRQYLILAKIFIQDRLASEKKSLFHSAGRGTSKSVLKAKSALRYWMLNRYEFEEKFPIKSEKPPELGFRKRRALAWSCRTHKCGFQLFFFFNPLGWSSSVARARVRGPRTRACARSMRSRSRVCGRTWSRSSWAMAQQYPGSSPTPPMVLHPIYSLQFTH